MQKDPYLILGVGRNSTQEQIREAYERLRARYQEERFLEGQVGADAARMLQDLEWAYAECLEEFEQNVRISGGYGEIESMIRDNKLEQAQNMLDAVESRDGEWHYLQAIIYHKRNWNFESKKQLEIALALEPGNEKFQKALDNLNKFIAGKEAGAGGAQTADATGQQTRAGYSRPDERARGAGNSEACCNTCSTLICCDCCCECFGGDLIPCC